MSTNAARQRQKPRQHFITVNANQNGNFQFDCDGKPALLLKVRKGDEIAWHCHQDGQQIDYEIIFEDKSPFSQQTAIPVYTGGHSGFFKVDQGELHERFKYSLNLPSVNWRHDPEVLIDDIE